LVGSGGESLLTTVKRVDPMYVQFHMSALDYLHARQRKAGYDEQRKLEKVVKNIPKLTFQSHFVKFIYTNGCDVFVKSAF
jgi:hypothetical protein